MKGIILAGGSGTRLWPLTSVISKQLLPIYDKPMVHYALSTLMLAGIRDLALISTPSDLPLFRRLLGDGSQWGVSFTFIEQPRPEGIAQAFLLAEEFIGPDPCALVLGDNLFFGDGLRRLLGEARTRSREQAVLFAYRVARPGAYGVVTFTPDGRPERLVEKPQEFLSSWAVAGLYFYPPGVADRARSLRPSARGELEITDLNSAWLQEGRLEVVRMGRGMAWLDTGTFDSMVEATEFVRVLQHRQNRRIACLEEIAWEEGWIDRARLMEAAERARNTPLGAYLRELPENDP